MKNSAAFLIFCIIQMVPYIIYGQARIQKKTPNLTFQLDEICENYQIAILKTALSTTKDSTTCPGAHIKNFLIYNTSEKNDVSPGYYYWSDNKWNNLKNIIKKSEFPITNGDPGDVYVDLSTRDVYIYNGAIWITKIINDKDLTSVKYNAALGLLIYKNGTDNQNTINLSQLVPNIGKPGCISINISRKTINYTDEKGGSAILDLRFLKEK